MVTTPNGKKIHFGAKGMSDYTKHKDDERKKNYIARHSVNENWNDPNTAGFWSRWVLWNKKTIKKSLQDMADNFNLSIDYKI